MTEPVRDGMRDLARRHVRRLGDALASLEQVAPLAARWGATLAERMPSGARLLVAGNGGSAAQAQHLTAEFVGRYDGDRRPFSAIALHAETSALTAIVNDYGPNDMFARQIAAHGRPGDVCLLLSTSGRSRNLLAATHEARRCGLETWAMTGPAPNPLAETADSVLVVDAASTATVQEAQLVALHVLCEAFDARLAQPAGIDARPALEAVR